MTDFRDRFEAQLQSAAQELATRTAQPASPLLGAPTAFGRRPGLQRPSRIRAWQFRAIGPRQSRRAASILVLAALFLIAAAVAVAAVAGVWRLPDGVLATDKQPSPALKSLLGVLRRPQTPEDRSPSVIRAADDGPSLIRPAIELNGVRLATTLPSGVQVFLAPEIPSAFERRQAGLRGDVVGLMLALHGRAGGGFCCTDVAHIESGGPGGGALGEMPRGAITIVAIVPDGVARVRMFFERQKRPTAAGYWPALTLTIPVHGNIAATTTTARAVSGELVARQTTWLAADGRVIKVLVNNHIP